MNLPTLVVHPDDITQLENLLPTFPDHIETLGDAVATKLVCDELNLPFMSSLGDLMVIGGTVGMTSKLMLALVHRAGHRIDVSISPTVASAVTSRIYDGKWEQTGEFQFTWEDAEAANLAAKDTYQMYPADMLGHKVVARAVRFAFPDVMLGYIPDEMEDIFPDYEAEFVPLEANAEFYDGDMANLETAIDAEGIAEVFDGEVVDEAQ